MFKSKTLLEPVLVAVFCVIFSGYLHAAAPAAPSNLSLTAKLDDKVTLYWNTVSNIGLYNVYQNGVFLTSQNNNVARINSLNQGVQYTFGVSSVDSTGVEGAISVYLTYTPQVDTGQSGFPPISAPFGLNITCTSGCLGSSVAYNGVSVFSSVLPSGAATSAKQDTGNTSLSSLDSKAVIMNTGAVSVSSSALPTGAATSALQTTINSNLSNVTVNTHAITVASLPLPSGASTEATLSALNAKATVINTGAVSISSSALPSGASTSSLQSTGNSSLGLIAGSVTGSVEAYLNSISQSAKDISIFALSISKTATSILSAYNNLTVNTHAVTINSAATGVAVTVSGTASVTAPTLTKGSQGATGFSTQSLVDSGRTAVTYVGISITGVTSEAMISLVKYQGVTVSNTATTFNISSGKTLRLQMMTVTWRNNTAAVGGVLCRFRVNSAAATAVTSPMLFSAIASTTAATAGQGTIATVVFPDGFELSGASSFGISQLAVSTVVGFDISLIGFEY